MEVVVNVFAEKKPEGGREVYLWCRVDHDRRGPSLTDRIEEKIAVPPLPIT